MADINRNDWERALEAAAVRASEAQVEQDKAAGAYDRGIVTPDPAAHYDDFLKRLKALVPFEGATVMDLEELDKFKSDDVRKWIRGTGPSPKERKREEEAAKFLPLLDGVAEDSKSWTGMSADALKEIATGMGYKPGTPEGFMEFLDKVGEYQRDYDRAQLVKEMRGTAPYVLGSLFAPSATQAIEGAVAKGEDLPASEAAKLAALDVGANTLMFEAPGLNLIKKGAVAAPILNSVIGTAGQFGGEIARQYGAQAMNDNIEADPVAAITAATMGATRPAIVSTAAGLAAKVPGKGAQDFARGIMRATRAGNPAVQEREGVERLVKNYNKFVKDGTLTAPEGATKELVLDLNKKAQLLETNSVRDMAKTLGVKPAKDGTYSAEEILKAYDKNFKGVVEITPNGVIDPKVPVSKVGENEILLTPINTPNYSRFAAQKIAEEKNKTGWRNLGFGAGALLGEFGGRVEPIIKLNPLNIGTQAVKDYKEQSWYKKLKMANPEAAKVFEEVMKQKDEEE